MLDIGEMAGVGDFLVAAAGNEAGETPVDEAPDVDTRRADVHARARQAMDDLKQDEG